MTDLQSVRSRGHKLQCGDVLQAFNTDDPIKRERERERTAILRPNATRWSLG